MKQATLDFIEFLTSRYDYINKFDAMKIGCKQFDLTAKEAKVAYESIEDYND